MYYFNIIGSKRTYFTSLISNINDLFGNFLIEKQSQTLLKIEILVKYE